MLLWEQNVNNGGDGGGGGGGEDGYQKQLIVL